MAEAPAKQKAYRSFAELCRGEKGYAFNLVDVTEKTTQVEGREDIVEVTDKKDVIEILEKQIISTQTDLQVDGKTTEWPYYIGITSTEHLVGKDLDPINEDTIKKDVISRNWQRHKREGKNGMVLLAIITQEFAKDLKYKDDPDPVPETSGNRSRKRRLTNPQSAAKKCALYIEEKLQKKLELREEDVQHHIGSVSMYDEAYLLYMAYKYTTPRNGTATPRPTNQPRINTTAYYSINLCDFTDATNIDHVKTKLCTKISELEGDLHTSTGRRVELMIHYFYTDIDHNTFKTTNSTTFGRNKILEKWNNHKRDGKDGMVVLSAFTDKMAEEVGCKDTSDLVSEVRKVGLTCTEDRSHDTLETDQKHVACIFYITFVFK